MYLNDCKSDLNEECVPKNRHVKHGTCQCKVGFRRNLNTLACDPVTTQDLINTLNQALNLNKISLNIVETTTKRANSRRRPLINDQSDELKQDPNFKSDESLLKEILEELGVEKLPTKNEIHESKTDELETNNFKTVRPDFKLTPQFSPISPLNTILSTSNFQVPPSATTIPTTTATTPTTTSASTKIINLITKTSTLTTKLLTDAPKIFTSQLIANAGEDINVNYPSSSVILNGSMSAYYGDGKIVKYAWSKEDSSPAFGVSVPYFYGFHF